MLLRSASENQKVAHAGVSVFEDLNFVPTRPASPDSPHFTVPNLTQSTLIYTRSTSLPESHLTLTTNPIHDLTTTSTFLK